jgi:hypothetical protein
MVLGVLIRHLPRLRLRVIATSTRRRPMRVLWLPVAILAAVSLQAGVDRSSSATPATHAARSGRQAHSIIVARGDSPAGRFVFRAYRGTYARGGPAPASDLCDSVVTPRWRSEMCGARDEVTLSFGGPLPCRRFVFWVAGHAPRGTARVTIRFPRSRTVTPHMYAGAGRLGFQGVFFIAFRRGRFPGARMFAYNADGRVVGGTVREADESLCPA